jgi:hypothetical protein
MDKILGKGIFIFLEYAYHRLYVLLREKMWKDFLATGNHSPRVDNLPQLLTPFSNHGAFSLLTILVPEGNSLSCPSFFSQNGGSY